MCGLIGAVGNLHAIDKDKFSTLFLLNVLRGAHGSGVFQMYEEQSKKYYSTLKTLKPSSSWVHTKEYRDFIGGAGTKLLMGHSRYATVGEKKVENCHPFEHDSKKEKIIGFHNGTIRGKFEGSDKYETDSEAFYALVHKKGLKEALDEVHKKCFSVAYALQFYDWANATVHLIRNNQRPLYLLKALNMEEYFWASEKEFLEFTFDRCNSRFDWIKEVPVNALVTIKPWEGAADRLKIEEDWYTPAKYESPFPSYTKTDNNHRCNYGAYGEGSQSWDNYYGSLGRFIEIGKIAVPFRAYRETLQQGCCVCSFPDTIYPASKELKQHFLPNSITDFVCNECATEDILATYDMCLDDLVVPKFVE